LKDAPHLARKLATNRRVLCASPAYLAARGTPRHPADLAHHECAILSGQRDWSFVTPTGPISVRVSGRLATDNGEVIRDALQAGMGIGLKSTWSVAPLLHSGELVTVLDSYPLAETVAIWAVYPSRSFVPPKTTAFIDFLTAHFGDPPYWDVDPQRVIR
jgi:DNA-binding transcriptional LysR family regulator